jgi:hypothetical protein
MLMARLRLDHAQHGRRFQDDASEHGLKRPNIPRVVLVIVILDNNAKDSVGEPLGRGWV